MDTRASSRPAVPLAQRLAERMIVASRWLLAPFYMGLAISVIVLLVKFAEKTLKLVSYVFRSGSTEVIPQILSLVDLSLLGNLIIMVMFAGYENFVSRLEMEGQRHKPDWMGQVDFGDLKFKLLTSIVAIASIHLLELFMNIGDTGDRELLWSLSILIVFVLTGILLAAMNRVAAHPMPPPD